MDTLERMTPGFVTVQILIDGEETGGVENVDYEYVRFAFADGDSFAVEYHVRLTSPVEWVDKEDIEVSLSDIHRGKIVFID